MCKCVDRIVAQKMPNSIASAAQQKGTAAQAMLEEKPIPASAVTYRCGAADHKTFTVPEISLLNQCMDEISFLCVLTCGQK
jgi:hypothetical protein